MSALCDTWKSVRGELRREAHLAGLTVETFQQMVKYGNLWVELHHQGCFVLTEWSAERHEDADVCFRQFLRAADNLKGCYFPKMTDEQLNAVAALHPFGFTANAFGHFGPSYAEAMVELSEKSDKELWNYLDRPNSLGFRTVTLEGCEVVQPAIEDFVRQYGDIMARRPGYRDEMWLEWDEQFNPRFISEWEPQDEQEGEALVPIFRVGEGRYRFPNNEIVDVTPGEDSVLKAFIGAAALELDELKSRSGSPAARDMLKNLKEREPFQGVIRMPGGKNRGGYRAIVKRADM